MATGTYNAGNFIHTHIPSTEPFGIISVGYQADLILVEEHPLEEIAGIKDIRGVMTDGRWFTSERLAEMRRELADKYETN